VILRYLLALYFWSAGILLTIFWCAVCAALHGRVVLLGLPRDGRSLHRGATMWGHSIIRLMPGWRVTVTGRELLIPDGQPSVIVANHESMADIWAMYYLGVQFRWLAKMAIFKLPIVGPVMRWAYYVPVERGNKGSGAEAMRLSAERLDKGLAMFFFPEGTRSEDGRIKPFKLGAFKLAQSAQVPVQPIALHGAGELLRKGSFVPNDSAHVQIKVLPALAPPGAQEDLGAYAEKVRALLISAHAQLT
jgi:1-acyl-sn-glycerol-3-phosphate acyltransferase